LGTLLFLVPDPHLARLPAYLVVGVELAVIAALRHRFFGTRWWLSILQVVGGGVLVAGGCLDVRKCLTHHGEKRRTRVLRNLCQKGATFLGFSTVNCPLIGMKNQYSIRRRTHS